MTIMSTGIITFALTILCGLHRGIKKLIGEKPAVYLHAAIGCLSLIFAIWHLVLAGGLSLSIASAALLLLAASAITGGIYAHKKDIRALKIAHISLSALSLILQIVHVIMVLA